MFYYSGLLVNVALTPAALGFFGAVGRAVRVYSACLAVFQVLVEIPLPRPKKD